MNPLHPGIAELRPPCPICASNRIHYLFSLAGERVRRCADCGLLLVNPTAHVPAPGLADSAAPRPGTSANNLQERLWQRLQRTKPTPGQRLLYIGPPTDPVPGHAREQGYTVVAAPAGADEFHEGGFAVAVVGDALNHVHDPRGLLTRIHELIEPGGILVAATPDLETWRNHTRNSVENPSGDRMCFYFDVANLQSLLFQTSFREIVVRPLNARDQPPRQLAEGCIIFARPAAPRPRPVLSVIVAAYNEAATVGEAMHRIMSKSIPGVDVEIIVVESNSTDGTRAIVERCTSDPRVRVILEDRPEGKGHAVRAGLAVCRGDFVLLQDADLEYDLEDYDALLEPLITGREAFVLGARHGGQTWKIRRFNDQPVQAVLLNLAHRAFTALINVSLGLRLSDPFTMYKVFRRDCLHGLKFECNRFDFDWELLMKLVRKGYRPLEIPVNYRSRSFKEGKKIRMIRDPLTWLRAWAKSRFGPLA